MLPPSRRQFLAAAGAASAAAAPARRPNVVFLLPDQFRAQALGCMGNEDVRTPHLDRLASEGLLLRRTFANTPVCCPARAILLTGKYAHRNGMIANDLRLREEETTLAELLREAGYRTGFIGKWHLDGGPRLPGFVPPGPRRQGFEFWAANQCSHRHFDNHYFRDTDQPIAMNRFETEGWADLGVEFLRETRRDRRPFFLTIQMGPPHDPYQAPPEYARLYDPAKLRMRPNWREAAGMPGPRQIAEYYGQVTAVDAAVGRIVRELDDLGLGHDTLVLVSSDHGDMLGSHGLPRKRNPWEESIAVPGIVRYPARVRAGRKSDALVSHVDFAPTLLSLCGVRPPAAMQGSDLSKVLTGQTDRGPDSVFLQIFGPFAPDHVSEGWRGVRTARFLYARYESRPWVLYDLERDPYQLKNLAGDPAARAIEQEMDRRLSAWMRKTGDSWSFNWKDRVEEGGRLYRHRAFYTVDEFLAWEKQNVR